MSDISSNDLPTAPAWRGINHLALVTPDMDATVRFYQGVLGMPVVATTMAGPMRHYFFEIAEGNTVAFFEVPGAATFRKPAGAPIEFPMQLDHLSFNVPDEVSLELLRHRVKAAGSEITDIVDHGFIRSVYFHDPNGIALEASCWVSDPTGRPPQFDNPNLMGDPNPVPALKQLEANGAIEGLPHTNLS